MEVGATRRRVVTHLEQFGKLTPALGGPIAETAALASLHAANCRKQARHPERADRNLAAALAASPEALNLYLASADTQLAAAVASVWRSEQKRLRAASLVQSTDEEMLAVLSDSRLAISAETVVEVFCQHLPEIRQMSAEAEASAYETLAAALYERAAHEYALAGELELALDCRAAHVVADPAVPAHPALAAAIAERMNDLAGMAGMTASGLADLFAEGSALGR